MLRELRISNFAIIENLRVEFKPGLNVLTGETGAGKSIILDALNLILGGRADTDFIRSGEKSAVVEGVLQLDDPKITEYIRELGFEVDDGQVIIKRNLFLSGKNRCFLNDSSITLGTITKLGDRLIDIHGQHDHQALLHPEVHVDLLDHYGKTMPDRRKFEKEYESFQADLKKLENLRSRERDRLQREDLLNFQLKELEEADLSSDEEETLKQERNKMRHAEKLFQSIDQIQNWLAEEEGSVLERLGFANKELESLPEIDPKFEKQVQRAQTAFFEIEELVEEIRDYARTIELNPSRLEEIEDRLAEINGLKRKYGTDITAILETRDKIALELEALSSNQETMDRIEKGLKEKEKTLSRLALSLAEERERTAKELKKNVEKELKDLNMVHVLFGVRFDYEPDLQGFVTLRGKKVKLTPAGLGEIEFLFSPNPGEELRPLAKIISGGELSRVMLALKTILNEEDTVPVMIFDEVDTGIGGKVAEQVGMKLKKLADHKQVFCITHLPQIAGLASAHFRVHKEVKGKRTHSGIRELAYEDRVEEVARMASGEKITESALEHAREMIQKA